MAEDYRQPGARQWDNPNVRIHQDEVERTGKALRLAQESKDRERTRAAQSAYTTARKLWEDAEASAFVRNKKAYRPKGAGVMKATDALPAPIPVRDARSPLDTRYLDLLKQGFMKQGRKVPKGKVWQCWLPNDEGMAYEGTSRPEAERLASKYGGTVKAADAARLHRALDAAMDRRASARDAQFSMSPAKVDAARKAWVAASEIADKLADECKAAEKLAEHWQEAWRNAKTPDEKAKAGAQCDLAGRAAGRARRISVDANIAEEKAKQALPAGLRKRM